MALYMTQFMSSPKTLIITYYRKQSQEHVSHNESDAFTRDAIQSYADFNYLDQAQVNPGTYRSGQGVPTGGRTYQI